MQQIDDQILDSLSDFNEEVTNTNSDTLKELSELSLTFVNLNREIEEQEEKLSELKKELKALSEKKIPTLMDELGLSELKTEQGFKISIKNEIFAKIPDENKTEAFEWLRSHDLDDVIKTEINIKYDKGENEKAIKNFNALIQKGFNAKYNESVHPMTLKSLIKEQLNNGSDIDLSLFGAFEFQKTIIK